MARPFQAIKAVARQTGLSPHVIRIWEKRYHAVTPERTETQRRIYSDSDIARLRLLRAATQAGHNIGQVAQLSDPELRQLVQTSEGDPPRAQSDSKEPSSRFFEECLDAVRNLNAAALEDGLQRAATELGSQGLLQRLIAPLAEAIGGLWRDGTITAAHEHFASAVLRIFLGHATRPFAESPGGPSLVVATPTGQLHELGALLVGAAAANLGWQVTYLGASLPAAEIAGAARQQQARAVALSLVYPEDDQRLEGELGRLRDLLPENVALLVGGRAAPAYAEALERIGACQIGDLAGLGSVLDQLRRKKGK